MLPFVANRVGFIQSQNCQQIDFVSPSGISKLFSCFAIGVAFEGAIDLIFLYMKLLLNPTCPMIHSSIIYIIYI
jgi:hypothetical protein